MKTVIVSPQIPFAYKNGGIGTFVYHFLLLLHSEGKEIEVIYTEVPQVPESEWRPFFKKLGITVSLLNLPEDDWPAGFRRSQLVSSYVADKLEKIKDVGIVYFADWRANGVDTIRRCKFGGGHRPIIVNILHGPSEWHRNAMSLWPSCQTEIENEFLERYAIENSDFVVCPSHYAKRWAKNKSWKLPADDKCLVLHYPYQHNTIIEEEKQTSDKRSVNNIIFFSRTDTRKGIELFIDSVKELKRENALNSNISIYIIGSEGKNNYGTLQDIVGFISKDLNLNCIAKSDLNMKSAVNFIEEHKENSLVVIPSLAETLGFVGIECSLINGLNVICSDNTALPEVFSGKAEKQLFEPTVKKLKEKISEYLVKGLMDDKKLKKYDYHTANKEWLKFHENLENKYKEKKRVELDIKTEDKENLVDFCIPVFNLGKYLDQALESLLSQTNKNFMVYVHDDGSTNSESLEFFQKAKSKYEKYGWKFSSATNQGVCESRNYLASLGKSKYLIWMDPDNIAAPDMVDQFIKGMEKSDYDVLTCWSYQFSGDESPYLNCMRGLRKADYHYIPVGNLPEVGMLDNPYGDVNCIMKRSKFYEAGGFTTHYPKNVNHEDRELLTRMSLMDMKIDIIPKFLFFYRIREDSRLRITSEFDNNQRVLDVYNDVKASNVNYRAIAELCLGYKHKDIEQQGHIDYLYKIAGHHIKNSELEVNLSKTVSYKSLLSALKKKVQRRIYTIFSNNY